MSAVAVGPTLRLPLLLALFVGSGAAALIYQIVWFQLLQLVIGSSAISLGILLGTFMGGMCIGSLGLARVISARHHPLRVYALLELGIATFGILVLYLIPLTADAYDCKRLAVHHPHWLVALPNERRAAWSWWY